MIALARILATMVGVAVVGAAGYLAIMFDGRVSVESSVEATNFAVQTLTTIGYGNWIPASLDGDAARILAMKAYSIPIMLVGATLFSVIVGIVANRLSR